MLKFHGHVFRDSARCACHPVGDAKAAVVVDPTNTGKLRAKFRMVMRQHWNQLRELTKIMLNKQDLLALKSGGLMNVMAPAITGAGSKIDVFQRWFDLASGNAVLQKDGSFMRPFISEAYAAGARMAQGLARTQVTHPLSGHREAALQSLARIELEGIIEAVSQQALRAVSQGLLTNAKPMAIVRSVLNVIEKVGVNRSNAMIELLVVRAHAEASLDIYEAAGLKAVGLVPESVVQARVVTDEKAQSTPKGKTQGQDARRRLGPGSRSSRTSVPSSRTISRIRAAELRVAKALGENVNVRTAGDFEVCPVCEQISENGPYSINMARALIPAHPYCRCTFVPADDARFATDTRGVGSFRVNEFELGQASSGLSSSDVNPYHDPETGQFTTGNSGPSGKTVTVYHGTGSQHLGSIMKGGINPSRSQEHLGVKKGVFVSTSREHALHFAKQNVGRNERTGKMTKPVVLEIKVPASEYKRGSPDLQAKAVGKKGHVIHRAIPKGWIVGGRVH